MKLFRIFKRPEVKHTEEEYNEMRRQLQSLNLTKKEEREIIWQALKTLMPGVLLVTIGSWSLVILFALIIVR